MESKFICFYTKNKGRFKCFAYAFYGDLDHIKDEFIRIKQDLKHLFKNREQTMDEERFKKFVRDLDTQFLYEYRPFGDSRMYFYLGNGRVKEVEVERFYEEFFKGF